VFKFPYDVRDGFIKSLFKGVFYHLAVYQKALVIDLFKRFEFVGRKIGQAGFSAQKIGYGFGELMKRLRSAVDDFTVVDAAGLLGQQVFVLSDEKVDVIVVEFARFRFGPDGDITRTVMEGSGSQILSFP